MIFIILNKKYSKKCMWKIQSTNKNGTMFLKHKKNLNEVWGVDWRNIYNVLTSQNNFKLAQIYSWHKKLFDKASNKVQGFYICKIL